MKVLKKKIFDEMKEANAEPALKEFKGSWGWPEALVPAPELKLGVVTALIGAPFFLHLVLKSRGRLGS